MSALPSFPLISLLPSPTPPSPPDDDRQATNAGTRTLTRAKDDIAACRGWLERFQDSPRTFEAYKREAERLLAWCAWRGSGLAQLMAEDVTAFESFLRSPPPEWCVVQAPRYLEDGSDNPEWAAVKPPPRLLPDGSPNPAWRPFIAALSPTASKQAMTVLFGLFEHLCNTGYLAGNPLRAARTRSGQPKSKKRLERYLERDAWQHIQDHVETWPRGTRREEAHYQRTRFLVSFLYLTGLRRSEMAGAKTSDIKRIEGQFWLNVIGKGNIDALVPLPDDAIKALKEYRESTGRPAWPQSDRPEPIVMDICGKGRPVTDQAIHQILKALFASAAAACPDPYHREKLRQASAHWMRHTAGSHLAETLPILAVRDVLRHASAQTTEIYIHSDARKLHESVQEAHRLHRSKR